MQVEIRADKKSMTVGGYVNVVGRDSRVLHDKTGPYVEQIMPGAFKKALAADSKVELRFNHKKILDSEDLERGHCRRRAERTARLVFRFCEAEGSLENR